MRARENKCQILQNDILHTKFSEIDLYFHNCCEIWRLNYSGTRFLSTDNKNYSISCDGFRLNIFKASRLHYYLTLLITAVFFFMLKMIIVVKAMPMMVLGMLMLSMMTLTISLIMLLLLLCCWWCREWKWLVNLVWWRWWWWWHCCCYVVIVIDDCSVVSYVMAIDYMLRNSI